MIMTMKISIKKALRASLLVSLILLTGWGGISADNAGDTTGTIGPPKRKIPLEKAVEKGIQLDAQYKNRLLDSEIIGLNRQKARMEKRFYVDLNGSYLFQSQQMEIVFPEMHPGPGVTIPGSTISAGSKHNYDLKLSLVQPIFTGGILSNRVKLETQKQVREKYRIHLRKIEVAGMIKASYFTYRLLENKKKSLSLLIESLKLHLKKITNLYNEDLVKKSDVLETKIKISETELKFEDLDQLLEEEKINFARLCGFAVEDIEKTDDEPLGTFRESLSFFKARHPALKTIDQEIRMLFLGKKIVSGNYLPRMKGFAELHYGKPGIDFFKNEWSLYFQGGVSINFKIFDWNQLKNEKQVLDQVIRQLNNQREDLAAEVKKKLAQWYAKKRSVEKQLKTVNRLVKFASEDAGLKQELYREQQAANIDFLSALLDRERYESLRNELILQVRLIKLNINTLIGRYGD